MFDRIIQNLTGEPSTPQLPDGILDIEKEDSPLHTDQLERAGVNLHNTLPQSRTVSDRIFLWVKTLESHNLFLLAMAIIGVAFGIATEIPLLLLEAYVNHAIGTDSDIILNSVQQTTSAKTIAQWKLVANGLTGGLLLGISGMLLLTVISRLKIEPASSGQLTFQVSSAGAETDSLYPRYLVDNASPRVLEGPIQTAHSANVQLNRRNISDRHPSTAEESHQHNEDLAILTHTIGMTESRPQDSFQQGTTASEIAPVDSDDLGLPIDEIGRHLNEAGLPIHYQVVVRGFDAADVLSDEYVAQLREDNVSARAGVAAKRKEENVERDLPRKFFHVNIRIIAYIGTRSEGDRNRAQEAINGIEGAIRDALPEYVSTGSKTGYSRSRNPFSRIRAKRALLDFKNRAFRKDRPSTLKSLIGNQYRQNIIIGASSVWGLMVIPGAGKHESQRAFDISPRDQWPTGEPAPSFSQAIQADYDPHRTTQENATKEDNE